MNIEEYISSGILEAYVQGDLSSAEMQEVERNLQQYPQLREELQKIEEVQENLLMQLAIAPSISVKQNILNAIETKPKGKVIPFSGAVLWKYAAAASVLLALVSSYLAFDFHQRWQSAQANLNELIAQNQQIAQSYNTVNLRLDRIEKDLKVVSDPAFARIVMKGTANATEALAFVYWNATTQEAYLSIQNMRTLAQENQYQLWAIVDGHPVDMGVFDGGQTALLKMKSIAKAAAFAVTVEPRGGKPSPTLTTMQVIGNV